jgi:hypothetical protein
MRECASSVEARASAKISDEEAANGHVEDEIERSMHWMSEPFESVSRIVDDEELKQIIGSFARVVSSNSDAQSHLGAAILVSPFVHTLVNMMVVALQDGSANSEAGKFRDMFLCPETLFIIASAAIDPAVFASLSACGFPFCVADYVELRNRSCLLPFLSLLLVVLDRGEFPENGQEMMEHAIVWLVGNDGLNLANRSFFAVMTRFFAVFPGTVISVLRDIDDGRWEGAAPRDAAGSLTFLLEACELFRVGVPTQVVRLEVGKWMVQAFPGARFDCLLEHGCPVGSLLRLVREIFCLCETLDPGPLLPKLGEFCHTVVSYRTWLDYGEESVGAKEELARLLVTMLRYMTPQEVDTLMSEYDYLGSAWIPGGIGWDIANDVITLSGMPFSSEDDVSTELRLSLRGRSLAMALVNRDVDALFALMWRDE